MKKIILAALGLTVAAGAYAQVDVVKAAERAMKDNRDASEVVEIMTPAFTNPETSGLAQTWYVPGKAAFNEYDRLLGLRSFNRLPEGGEVKMGQLLIDGYGYFIKALPLDSVPDAKGKVKPKYSKDIVGTVAGHSADFFDAGVTLYNAGDHRGAYEAWGLFNAIPENPVFASKIDARPDSVYGEVYFNQALAAWQLNNFDDALQAFLNAKNKGYKKKGLYDYAIAVAQAAGKNDTLLALAEEAIPLYGDQDDMYMGQVVNYYLQANDFDNAFRIINQAIANNPEKAQYYVIQGVLYENNEQKDEAFAAYTRAKELDPDNTQALFNYGRMLCEKAYAAADAAPTVEAQYVAYAEENILPLFRQAAVVLEHAYEVNPEGNDVTGILNYLENIYYNLQDEAKLNDVKQRKML